MFLDQFPDAVDLFSVKGPAALQPNWVKPKLRLAVVAFDVDVWRLATIAGIEKEPERTHLEYSRHGHMLHRPNGKSNTLQ